MSDVAKQYQPQQARGVEAHHLQLGPIETTQSASVTPTDQYGEIDSEATNRPCGHQHAHMPLKATTTPLLGTEKIAIELNGWPTLSKSVYSPNWMIVWNGMFDLLLFAGAISFLTFAAVVSRYDRASTLENPRATSILLNATKYGPTVFPILFALTFGRATHVVFRWRLECGERVGVLDTLAASTSLTSTVVSQFQLRTISTFGVVLVFLWALSPVGGQASLRQMTIGTSNTTQHAIFDYLVHNGYTVGFLNSGSKSQWQVVNSIFLSAVIGSAASRSSPTDNWGNVKIPRLEHYEANAIPDNDGWYDTTLTPSDSYVSMVGIPISGISSVEFVDYQMRIHTSYLQTACSLTTYDPHDRSSHTNLTTPSTGVLLGPGAVIQFDDAMRTLRSFIDPKDLIPLQFSYTTRLWGADNYQLACNLTSSYAETEIACSRSTSCKARKVRRSRLDSPPPAWTLLDTPAPGQPVLFSSILHSTQNRDGSPTILDKYLSDPDSTVTVGENLNSVPPTSEENFSVRLAQLMNSYFTVMNGMYTITGGLNNNTAYFWDHNITFTPPENSRNSTLYLPEEIAWYQFLETGGNKGKVWSARGTKSRSTEVIVAHKPWVITLLIASIILISGSLVSPLLHLFLIRAPEVMINVSSLATRNNAYIPLPEGGTHLGASARARLLKGLQVQFGDIERGSSVGHLVIGALRDAGNRDIAKVRKGRLYE